MPWPLAVVSEASGCWAWQCLCRAEVRSADACGITQPVEIVGQVPGGGDRRGSSSLPVGTGARLSRAEV